MKEDIVKYVRTAKGLFTAFAAVCIPAIMLCAVFAFSGYRVFFFIAPAILVLFLAVYAVYAMRVSMGTVLGVEFAGKTFRVKTKRKTFTYDLRSGCVRVKVSKRKFVCTFRTQDSEDSFLFYRHPPLVRWGAEQFTEEEIRTFYPALAENTDNL